MQKRIWEIEMVHCITVNGECVIRTTELHSHHISGHKGIYFEQNEENIWNLASRYLIIKKVYGDVKGSRNVFIVPINCLYVILWMSSSISI